MKALIDIIKARVPSHWSVEEIRTYGILIGCSEGFVNVDEKMRNHNSGMSPVRERGAFKGAKWKERLADEAISKLAEHENYWTERRKKQP